MNGLTRRRFAQSGLAAMLLAAGGAARGAGRIDPAVLAHIDPTLRDAARTMMQQPPLDLTPATLAAIRAKAPPAPAWLPTPAVERVTIAGLPGQPPVTAYLINARAGAARPAIIHMHGGGQILGSARFEVPYEQDLARTLDCAVLTVEYRLAPETTWQGSTADTLAALRWLHAQAGRIGVDPARIVAMGESAGGGQAALLALAARDRGGPPLAGQVLIYPMLDDRTGSSVQLPAFQGAFGWTPAANRFGWSAFLGVPAGSARVPVAAVPARTAALAGLPPTFIAVGGADLFAREDIDYARRLTEAGVPTELLVVPGAFHGFDRVVPAAPPARQFTAAKLAALRRMLAPAA